MIHWLILIITIGVLFVFKSIKPPGFPSGPPSLPVVGAFPFVRGSPHFHLVLQRLSEQYGPVVGLKFGNLHMVAVVGPSQVVEALAKVEFQGRPKLVRAEIPRPGIIFQDGEHWKQQRRFTLRHLRDFGFGKSSAETQILQEAEEFFQESLRNTSTIQVAGLFSTSAINVIWSMLGGRRFSHHDTEFQHLVQLLRASFRSDNPTGGFLRNLQVVRRLFPKWSGRELHRTTEANLREFFAKCVEEHRASRTETARDFMDLYLAELEKDELHPSFSENTLVALCMDLFTAGAESLGNSLGFILLRLVLHPQWQERLRAEVLGVLGKEALPSLDDKERMPLVNAFISEVARVNSVSPLSIPRRSQSAATFHGHVVPAHSFLLLSLWSVHHDKDHWGNPEVFRPQRFLDNEGRYRRNERLLSFGGGARSCIGESLALNFLFLFLVLLVREFRFAIPPGHPPPCLEPEPGFVPAPQPYEVTVHPRETE